MGNQSYYTVEIQEANRCITDVPLVVNCVGQVSLTQDFGNQAHNSRRDYYLIYMTKGEMELVVEGKVFQFQPGQFVIIPPETSYHYHNLSQNGVDYYWVHFTGGEAESLLKQLKLPLRTVTDITIRENIVNAFHRLFDEYLRPDDFFACSTASLLTALCVRFARAVQGTGVQNEGNRLPAHVLSYIHNHYREELSVSALAGQANLSYGYFSALFRRATGMTPNAYITDLRLKNACMLLYQTNLSVKEIALQVGFSDQLYFSRVFRKNYGLSPLAYRRENAF